MTKSELVDAVARQLGITKSRAEQSVDVVFRAMTEAMQRGDGIEIRGFGSFKIQHYESYLGRNPQNGEPVQVPKKRLPRFKVGKELRVLVNALTTAHKDSK